MAVRFLGDDVGCVWRKKVCPVLANQLLLAASLTCFPDRSGSAPMGASVGDPGWNFGGPKTFKNEGNLAKLSFFCCSLMSIFMNG